MDKRVKLSRERNPRPMGGGRRVGRHKLVVAGEAGRRMMTEGNERYGEAMRDDGYVELVMDECNHIRDH